MAKVAWDAVEGATDYDLNYNKTLSGRWTNWPIRGARRAYTTVYGLEPDTEYRWAVRAENRDGASDWVFGENFTTSLQETLSVVLSTSPDSVTGLPLADSTFSIELFEEACLEIHQTLEDFVLRGTGEVRSEPNGYVRIYSYMIAFRDYSDSGRFSINGAVNIDRDSEDEDFLLRGQMWLREVDGDHSPFIIATRSSIDLDRRKRNVVRIESKFAEVGKDILVDVKDDLIESITIAYNGSLILEESTTYIDGFSTGAKPFVTPLEDSFIFIESVSGNKVNWEFEAYSFEGSDLILWGTVSEISIDQVPTPIGGELFVYRNSVSEELLGIAHPRIAGGLRSFNVGINLLSDGTEGELRILGRNGIWTDSTRAWTLEELSVEHVPYYFEIP